MSHEAKHRQLKLCVPRAQVNRQQEGAAKVCRCVDGESEPDCTYILTFSSDFSSEQESRSKQQLPTGPVMGPARPPAEVIALPPMTAEQEVEDGSAPTSPFTANRSLLRELTVPSVPNYDIPPSPPDSPRESTTAKFRKFLELKEQGVHFNERLARSTAMRNPGLTQNLIDFAGIGASDQYATSLPTSIWDPKAVPEAAFKEQLTLSQQKIAKERERSQGGAMAFVAATADSEGGRATGKASAPQSAAERVMVGLETGRLDATQLPNSRKKSRFGPDVNL